MPQAKIGVIGGSGLYVRDWRLFYWRPIRQKRSEQSQIHQEVD